MFQEAEGAESSDPDPSPLWPVMANVEMLDLERESDSIVDLEEATEDAVSAQTQSDDMDTDVRGQHDVRATETRGQKREREWSQQDEQELAPFDR